MIAARPLHIAQIPERDVPKYVPFVFWLLQRVGMTFEKMC